MSTTRHNSTGARRIAVGAVAFVTATLGLVPAARAATPPTNDRVTSPTVITAVPTTITQNTQGATRARTDPDCVGEASVWYSFTPRTTTTVRLVTVGTEYDSLLAVYRGTATEANNIACGDDEILFNAAVQVRLAAGTRYLIAVSSYESGGPTRLSVYAPAALKVSELAVQSAVAGQVSGQLFLTGTIRCSNPSVADVTIAVSQLVRRRVARGSAEIFPLVCLNTTNTWHVAIDTETGYAFRPRSPAAVSVYADVWDGWQGASPSITVYPQLTPGRGI